MKIKKDILIGIFAGLVLGIPQGFQDLQNFSELPLEGDWKVIAVMGGLFGFFLGAHLLSRANEENTKHAAFAFFFVGCISIAVPTILRHYHGSLLESINMPAVLFLSVATSMALGGLLSLVASKRP